MFFKLILFTNAFLAISVVHSKLFEFELEIEIISTTLVAFSGVNWLDTPNELDPTTGDVGYLLAELPAEIYSVLL